MAWILTPERRDAVVLHLLGNALQALEEDRHGNRRRVARLWIERATEVLRGTAYLDPSPLQRQRKRAVEAVLDRIALRMGGHSDSVRH